MKTEATPLNRSRIRFGAAAALVRGGARQRRVERAWWIAARKDAARYQVSSHSTAQARMKALRRTGNRYIRKYAQLTLPDGKEAEVELTGSARSWSLSPDEPVEVELWEGRVVSLAHGGHAVATPEHPDAVVEDAHLRTLISVGLALLGGLFVAGRALRRRWTRARATDRD